MIDGGLGNQFFMYAFARAYAVLHDCQTWIMPGHYQKMHNGLACFVSHGGARVYYALDRFAITLPVALPVYVHELAKRHPPAVPGGAPGCIVQEPEGAGTYVPGMLDWREDAIFRGYWQSEKYFASIRDVLCGELTLRESLDAYNADLLRQIQNSMAVGLNVRRGDYLKLRHLHPLCTAAYFNRAIAYIEQHVRQPHFFVYSDDLPWCREHLCLHSEVAWLEVPSHERWYPVMEVVRHCRHHIISNSTFS